MRVLVRADGDGAIGTGHVMRTLALAERIRGAGGEATLLSSRLDDGLRRRVEASGVRALIHKAEPGSPADAATVVAAASSHGCRWVIVDSYAAGTSFQEALRSAGLQVLLIDDYATAPRIAADIVLNQNVFASREMYDGRVRGDEQLLLGPAYALLRSEFSSAVETRRGRREAAHILVTLGGADPRNISRCVLDALLPMVRDRTSPLSLTVVVGASNPHRETLSATDEGGIEIQDRVDNMVPLMKRADIAVAGAGITVYELMALGVPTCVIPAVPSQRGFAAALARSGACEVFDEESGFTAARFARQIDALRHDEARRAAMSGLGQKLVDGRGAERVAAALASHV